MLPTVRGAESVGSDQSGKDWLLLLHGSGELMRSRVVLPVDRLVQIILGPLIGGTGYYIEEQTSLTDPPPPTPSEQAIANPK